MHTFLQKRAERHTTLRIIFHTDRMAEGRTTMRRGAPPYWFYRGLPFVYPIVPNILTGRAE